MRCELEPDFVNNQALTIHFGRSGQPIIFTQEATSHRVEFVFATLDHGLEENEDDDDDMHESETNQVHSSQL
jgi:hypothetical protein